MSIESLVAQYGLAALFAGAALEGEAAVIAGGLLAHQGLLSLPGAAAAAAAGSFLADQGWFAFGRHFRDQRWVAKLRATAAFARAQEQLERHPRSFIFVFRFLYGLRTVSPIAVGTTNISQRQFFVINLVAAIIWAVIFTGIGYVFGDAVEEFVGRLRHDARLWWIVGGVVAAGLIVAAIHWWRGRSRA